MFTRSISICIAVLALAAFAATSAMATDTPAPGNTPGGSNPGAPGGAAPGAPGGFVPPGACADTVNPASSIGKGSASKAKGGSVLRGTASDRGCGVDRVEIAIARKVGKSCSYLSSKRKLRRSKTCSQINWLQARGTKRWTFRIPRALPRGIYIVRTRAIDLAGNEQSARSRRVRVH